MLLLNWQLKFAGKINGSVILLANFTINLIVTTEVYY